MADKTKRELAAEEREKIPVESITKEDIEKKEEDKEEEKEEEIEVEDKDEKDDADKEEEKDDTKDDKEEDKDDDEEEEEKEDDAEKLKVEAKAKRQQDRMQKRIDKAVATAKAAQEEAAELKKQLEANPEKKLTEDEVERRAKAIADKTVLEREFVNDCNKLFDGAVKINKDFKKNVDALTDEIGAVPAHMIGILSELENGAKVLEHLSKADNVDEAEDIWTLNPSRMAARLAKLSIKLEEEGKIKPKELSKVPPAKKGIGGKQTAATQLLDNEPMDDWVRKRNQQVKERQEAKRAGYR